MIYQLAKTTPLLSGQIRWDMCLTNKSNETVIESLHIVPLSDSIVFNEDNSHKVFNYSHVENVKRLYNIIEDQFFSNISIYNSKYQLFNSGQRIDPFDHTYEMGLRRIRYQRYNKQFSFLCPMWISEKLDYSKLYFIVSIEDANPTDSTNSRRINTKTRVSLSQDMIDYLDEYMSTNASGVSVNDDLISLKFDPVNAYITGLQVDSARISTIDISNILSDITSRERPLLEFDNIILRQFSLNKIVAQQLVNFNLVFNIADLVNEYTARSLQGHDINISVNIYYDDQLVDIKDFYTNYTNVPAYDINNDTYTLKSNVLDYLQDHKCRDLVYTNKVTQPIFHWALLENPSMVYNMYDGFGPTFTEDGETYRIHGLYYNQADIQTREYDITKNTLEWCRHYDLSWQDQATEVRDASELTDIEVKDGIIWISGNKFNLSGKIDSSLVGPLKVCTATYQRFEQVGTLAEIGPGGPVRCIYKTPAGELQPNQSLIELYMVEHEGDGFVFMSNSNDNLTLASIYDAISVNQGDILSGSGEYVRYLKCLKLIFENWIAPFKVVIRKSIVPRQVRFEEEYAEVIDYFKDDNTYVYLYRYTGSLIPSFIDIDDPIRYNLSFYYKQWSDPLSISEYNRLIKLGYIPEYPEHLEGENTYVIDPDSFYSLLQCKFTSKHDSWYDDWKGDITWLNDSRVWYLPEQIDISGIFPNSPGDSVNDYTETEINDFIWNLLYQYIIAQIPRLEDLPGETWCRKWIYSKYSLIIEQFEYNGLQDINHIKYFIKFKLQ